jgi:hypothetical protein
MRRLVYLLVLAGMLVGYFEVLGPGPSPSEYVEDLEWWRPWGFAHTWPALAGLERLAEAGWAGALVGLFWLPPVAMLVWGLMLFRSAVLRILFSTSFFLLLIIPWYGYMAERVWRFFEWRSLAVAAAFAGVTAAALFAPSLLRGALVRSRVWAAVALALVFAGVFLLTTEVTGTDSSMRLNISPWPVVTLFGLLLIGSALASFHVASGLGAWLAARLGGARGLGAGAAAAGVLAAALTWATLTAPGAWLLLATAFIGASYAVARSRLGPESRDEAARAGAVALAAGLFAFLSIHLSNRVAIAFQTTARNETSTRLLVALDDFREAHGRYPKRLKELVPDILPEVPYPRIGLIRDEDDEFTYRNLGDSFLLEFSSVQWVQCGYSPPFNIAEYSEEDFEDGDDEDDEELEEVRVDPELEALLAEHGLDGAWNCEDAPPKLW